MWNSLLNFVPCEKWYFRNMRRANESTDKAFIWPHQCGVVRYFLLYFYWRGFRHSFLNFSCRVTSARYLCVPVSFIWDKCWQGALMDTPHPLLNFRWDSIGSRSWIPSRAVAVLSPDHLIHQREAQWRQTAHTFKCFQIWEQPRHFGSSWVSSLQGENVK